jgi:xanthine dehydrogenase accessory factor
VEASVAAEALIAMEERHDRQISFGEGSPYFDIVLPCGGGITVAIHVLNDVETLRRVLLELENRRPVGLAYNPATQSLSATQPPTRSAWDARGFVSVYRPPTRLIISGHTIEAQTTARHGEVSGCEVIAVGHSDKPGDIAKMLDVHTAVVFLHHDLDVEAPLLRAVLPAAVFYIGALGSTQTHRERIIRLRSLGFEDADLCRIKAPIGMFGPARDAQSLALSVLADVAASRLAAFG